VPSGLEARHQQTLARGQCREFYELTMTMNEDLMNGMMDPRSKYDSQSPPWITDLPAVVAPTFEAQTQPKPARKLSMI